MQLENAQEFRIDAHNGKNGFNSFITYSIAVRALVRNIISRMPLIKGVKILRVPGNRSSGIL